MFPSNQPLGPLSTLSELPTTNSSSSSSSWWVVVMKQETSWRDIKNSFHTFESQLRGNLQGAGSHAIGFAHRWHSPTETRIPNSPIARRVALSAELRSEERRVNQKNEMGGRSHPFQAGVDTNVVLTVQGEECQAKEWDRWWRHLSHTGVDTTVGHAPVALLSFSRATLAGWRAPAVFSTVLGIRELTSPGCFSISRHYWNVKVIVFSSPPAGKTDFTQADVGVVALLSQARHLTVHTHQFTTDDAVKCDTI